MLPLFKKCLIILVAVLTFGTVVPNFSTHYVEKEHDKDSFVEEKRADVAVQEPAEAQEQWDDEPEESKKSLPGQNSRTTVRQNVDQIFSFFDYTSEEAKNQGLHKFGARISRKIGDTYTHEIVPMFASVIFEESRHHDPAWIDRLAVTHAPASGMGERIIHIYQSDTGQEVLKLHVRRDHPPQDGYWFDFHYHTAADGFAQHHELKKIYWGKDMPPQWRV